MERIQSIKRAFNNRKGFTLVEIAIVLVIIGIILGAALKGKDLISGARYKKFINAGVHAWTTTSYNYMDRMGRFPGDTDKDGIIGDGNVKTEIVAATFTDNPPQPLNLGSFTFYFFLGGDGATPNKNVMVVCANIDCTGTFDAEQLKYIEAFDTSTDGSPSGTTGLVRCLNTAPTSALIASYVVVPSAAATISEACTAGTTLGMAYYFDRAP